MRAFVLPLAGLLGLVSPVAQASEALTSGEFRNTAHTLEQGRFALHPLFMVSTYGLTDAMDVKVGLLGLVAGPNGRLEVALIDGAEHALSIEPAASASWDLHTYSAGVTVNNTFMLGQNRLNLQAGTSFSQMDIMAAVPGGEPEPLRMFQLPIGLGFDLVLSEQTIWRFTGNAELIGLADTPAALFSASWNKALANRFRLALGVGAYYGDNPLQGLPLGPLGELERALLPLPTFELWWKF